MKLFTYICMVFLFLGNARAETVLFPKTYGEVHAAEAAQKFCEKLPQECRPPTEAPVPVELTRSRWEELRQINEEVNRTVNFKTDLEIYGVLENWTLNEREGDCEDLALLKRKLLMARGWPSGALLITVVDPPNDPQMHAVLAARTSKGDFILDSKLKDGTTRIWRWDEIPSYTYVAQQSPHDPHRWLSLIPLPTHSSRYERWVTSK
jgi:predicted transglutaminase-like cysteine proteinase